MARSLKSGYKKKSRGQDRRQRNKSVEAERPEKPRRYLTAYIIFLKSCWKEQRTQNPNEHMDRENFQQFSRDCADRWRELSDREKRPFQKKSDKDKQRYEEEMATYKAKENERKKSVPKRPLGSYFLFCSDERPKVREAMPDAKMVEVAKELGRRWQKCDPKEKAKYEAEAVKARERYYKQLEDADNKKATVQKAEQKKDKDRHHYRSRSVSRSASLSSGDASQDFSEDDQF